MSGGELILRIVAREFRGRFRSYPTAAPSPIQMFIAFPLKGFLHLPSYKFDISEQMYVHKFPDSADVLYNFSNWVQLSLKVN